MRHALSLFVLAHFFLRSSSQDNQFDLVQEIKKNDSSITLAYLSAAWCHPCMEKLPIIVNSFKEENINLILLFDRTNFKKIQNRLFDLYDSTLFKFIPDKYRETPARKFISVYNPGKVMFKNLLSDMNQNFNTSLTIDDFWFGQAIIFCNGKFYITKDMSKNGIIDDIKKHLSSSSF